MYLDIKKYNLFNLYRKKSEIKELINREITIHECKEIKALNENYNLMNENLKRNNYISIIGDVKSKVWELSTSYWNNEYKQFNVTSAPVVFCPFCGEKLV